VQYHIQSGFENPGIRLFLSLRAVSPSPLKRSASLRHGGRALCAGAPAILFDATDDRIGQPARRSTSQIGALRGSRNCNQKYEAARKPGAPFFVGAFLELDSQRKRCQVIPIQIIALACPVPGGFGRMPQGSPCAARDRSSRPRPPFRSNRNGLKQAQVGPCHAPSSCSPSVAAQNLASRSG